MRPLLLPLFVIPLYSQPVRLSLSDVLESALRNHPAVALAQAAIEEQDARIRQARAGYYPQIGFNGIAKAGLSGATNALGLVGLPNSPFYRNFADSLNFSQTALDFGRARHLVAYEQRRREALEADLQTARAAVRIGVERAYYAVLRAHKLQAVGKEVLRSQDIALRQARAFYEAELRSRVDLELARVAQARAQLRLHEADNQARIAEAGLARAAGLDQEMEFVLDEPQAALPPPGSLRQSLADALRNRPELHSIAAASEAAAERVRWARSERKPLLSFAFSGGYARFTNLIARELMAGGAGLILPLFTGGRINGQIEEAEAQMRAVESRREDWKQQIALEVRAAYVRLENARDALPLQQVQIDAAQQATRLASERYKEKLGTLVELIDAQAALAEAAASQAAGLYDVRIAASGLAFAAGTL